METVCVFYYLWFCRYVVETLFALATMGVWECRTEFLIWIHF